MPGYGHILQFTRIFKIQTIFSLSFFNFKKKIPKQFFWRKLFEMAILFMHILTDFLRILEFFIWNTYSEGFFIIFSHNRAFSVDHRTHQIVRIDFDFS